MYAITFDLDYPNPNYAAQIKDLLQSYGFRFYQKGFYLADSTDMSDVFAALSALKTIPWFVDSVVSVRAFEVEHWSDFTDFVKSPITAPRSKERVIQELTEHQVAEEKAAPIKVCSPDMESFRKRVIQELIDSRVLAADEKTDPVRVCAPTLRLV